MRPLSITSLPPCIAAPFGDVITPLLLTNGLKKEEDEKGFFIEATCAAILGVYDGYMTSRRYPFSFSGRCWGIITRNNWYIEKLRDNNSKLEMVSLAAVLLTKLVNKIYWFQIPVNRLYIQPTGLIIISFLLCVIITWLLRNNVHTYIDIDITREK